MNGFTKFLILIGLILSVFAVMEVLAFIDASKLIVETVRR